MPKKWFIHLQGDTFGPLPTDLVNFLLRQNRLQFSDFVWTIGMKRWQRFSEITDFESLLSPYPSVAPPKDQADAEVVPFHLPPASPSEKPPAPKLAAKAESKDGTAAPVQSVWAAIRRGERVAIDAKVEVEGYGNFNVMNISETGIILKAAAKLKVGVEVKFLLESESFAKPLSMTGVTIREGVYEGEAGVAIEFTKVNPAHKRTLQEYVKNTLSSKAA